MADSKPNKKKGKIERGNLTPELVEQATMEIIKESIKILKDYELKGVITNIEIGLFPVNKKKVPANEAYDFLYSDLFSLLINLKK